MDAWHCLARISVIGLERQMPTFYHSAEVRWFVTADDDNWRRVQSWFAPGDPKLLIREPERTDAYLLMPTRVAGVKQRQGKLEIKTLTVEARTCAFAGGSAEGLVDEWVKWSFESGQAAALETELTKAGPWCRVIKDRFLQKYSYAGAQVSTVSPSERPDEGCNIELTRLALSASQWDRFTIGFEAFGAPERTATILAAGVERFFADHGRAPIDLRAADSLNYPAFLLKVPGVPEVPGVPKALF
jgi:hypothetical protein